MDRLTISGTKEAKNDVTIKQMMDRLSDYEDLGYTPEELRICFSPPDVLYVIGEEYDGTKIHPAYPVDGEQLEFSKGNVWWNCRDDFGDYVEVPLDGLHTDYFLTFEEASDAWSTRKTIHRIVEQLEKEKE